MKTIILAGGLGTRLSSKTSRIPKPLIRVGGHPILWHLMKIYSHYGYSDFIICGGYKVNQIKKYFANYYLNHYDIKYDFQNNNIEYLKKEEHPWNVSVIDTGLYSGTGSRIRKIKKQIHDTFLLTYGDGLSNININNLIEDHKRSKKICTMSTILPSSKFGVISFENEKTSFSEKPISNNWINAGFFVCEPQIFDYIPEEDDCLWERTPLQNLFNDDQVNVYKHNGFWHCMDTPKDHLVLNEMWKNNPEWRIWNE